MLLAERITDTKHRAEEVAVFIGPLLTSLLKAVFKNATATDIGESLGYKPPQASAVGNVLLQMALEAAANAYDMLKTRERVGLTYADWLEQQSNGMPVPARKAKNAYATLAKNKTKTIAAVEQAMAANDNRRVAMNNAA